MLGTGRNANNSERLTVGLAVAMAILCAHNGGLLRRRGGWERSGGGGGGGLTQLAVMLRKAPGPLFTPALVIRLRGALSHLPKMMITVSKGELDFFFINIHISVADRQGQLGLPRWPEHT